LQGLRARWWLAQGRLTEVSDWARRVVFLETAWDSILHEAFPIVIRLDFAQQRWRKALEVLDSFHEHLDRPTNITSTLTFLAQSLVALHQTGQQDRACEIAARLFTLTEPEGYLRVYLDEGEPMRQALQALLTQPHAWDPSSHAYVKKILAAFAAEASGAGTSLHAAPTSEPAPSLIPPAAPASSARAVSLTGREQEILRLLAEGASNRDIAQALVISLETVKKHVSHLLGKLDATSRTQAIAQARARALL